MQGKRWCFTLNNYSDKELEMLKLMPSAADGGWEGILRGGFAKEVGESGTPHLQGWVIFQSNKRLNTLKKLFPRIHLELMKGSEQQSFDYCNKTIGTPDYDYHSYGDPKQSEQGKRTELDEVIHAATTLGKRAAAAQDPGTYAKYHRGIDHVVELLLPEYKPPTIDGMFAWQKELFDLVDGDSDDRTIIWVEDRKGGQGKSTMARHLISTRDAVLLDGKPADMAFIYKSQPIVIFDIARADNVIDAACSALYGFAEKLKNGMIVSTKYESKTKYFKPPHVIFFSNSPPPYGIWTEDRLKHISLNNH